MINYVPTNNKLINEYQKKPASGPRPLTPEMQKPLDEANNPKKGDLDENLRIAREADAREKELCDAQVTLETEKSIFPTLTIEHIMNEAVENPSIYWLDPVVSFDLENTLDS
ncbi:unnamed protein product [Lactuca saligna]|uniref:Uncharacterized protein n=1 Tax=Lactuca saligna TaxID=75948 RepID=A0AA36E5W8_LACSI|nr:unnamed protein product [Lactuca saligna]